MSARGARPRVLFVGRGRLRLPLPGWLARKWDAIGCELDYRVLGAAAAGSLIAHRPATQSIFWLVFNMVNIAVSV